MVVNASGPWADMVRSQISQPARLRRLRGSHLIFPRERLPMKDALTLLHPKDNRAMFVIPWEGTTIIGTTDIDHDPALDKGYTEPFASNDEISYMMEAASFLFPTLGLKESDMISSFSGVRPIIQGGADTPGKESRGHALWQEDGLITITGGKYTTFRIMARQTVMIVLAKLGKLPVIKLKRVFPRQPDVKAPNIDPATLAYLTGRHGGETADLIKPPALANWSVSAVCPMSGRNCAGRRGGGCGPPGRPAHAAGQDRHAAAQRRQRASGTDTHHYAG